MKNLLILLPLVSVLLLPRPADAQGLETLTQVYPDSLCPSCAEWDAPQEPFLIHGNTFYVGTRGLSSILITSPEGHILIDGAKPDDRETIAQPAASPLAELVADFEDLSIEEEGGERRAVAKVKLRWSATGHKPVESKRFKVRSPLGPIEIGELAWYLERYAIWPGEVFRPRAKAVEDALVEMKKSARIGTSTMLQRSGIRRSPPNSK